MFKVQSDLCSKNASLKIYVNFINNVKFSYKYEMEIKILYILMIIIKNILLSYGTYLINNKNNIVENNLDIYPSYEG
jgi:hypothetical protein